MKVLQNAKDLKKLFSLAKLWAIENKLSRDFALATLLTSSWDYFCLLIVIANRTTWLNTKVTANRHIQPQPKLDTNDTSNIHQAPTILSRFLVLSETKSSWKQTYFSLLVLFTIP